MTCKDILRETSILLVEDELTLATLLRDAIGDQFDRFILAHDGEDGLEKAHIFQPDIVITDITMPKMNGLEMSTKLRETSPDLPIVILSAYSQKEYLLEAIDVGITKYLIKPFDPDELMEIVCKLAKIIQNDHNVPLLPPFHFNLDNKKLFKDDIMINLSKRENRFISLLLNSPNYFMSPEDIKSKLWNENNVADERLRVFINRLRKKTSTDLIGNIVGQGYVLNRHSPITEKG
jgi:DNA-binding response OmpR family regulator